MANDIKLKPCPFCGGKATLQEGLTWLIGCDTRGCIGYRPYSLDRDYESAEEATRAWNRRCGLEAAHKRENDKRTVGNAAAMREALEFIKLASDDYEKYGNTKAGALDVIYEKAQAALSAPPRNCDVGTAEEQYARHDKYCNSQPTCRKCLEDNAPSMCILCFAKLAQMSYAAEEGGEK